jgi:hypothetical protein
MAGRPGGQIGRRFRRLEDRRRPGREGERFEQQLTDHRNGGDEDEDQGVDSASRRGEGHQEPYEHHAPEEGAISGRGPLGTEVDHRKGEDERRESAGDRQPLSTTSIEAISSTCSASNFSQGFLPFGLTTAFGHAARTCGAASLMR